MPGAGFPSSGVASTWRVFDPAQLCSRILQRFRPVWSQGMQHPQIAGMAFKEDRNRIQDCLKDFSQSVWAKERGRRRKI
uniref:Uncharacterized protein n=1 Tax=Sphaerodactylus townsendi TaxID=933632 RepID=A0ACB8G8K6_9SAUR